MKVTSLLILACISTLTGISLSTRVSAQDNFQAQPINPAGQGGSASVTIAPIRVVLTPGRRTAAVNLLNTGNGTGAYTIDFVDFSTDDTGKYIPLEQVPDTAARDIVRFSPRRGRLQPQQSRRVLLSARAPRELEDGEYRSHLRIITETTTPTTGVAGGKNQIQVGVGVRQGLSIPVIFRKGRLQAVGAIENPRLLATQAGTSQLELTLTRTGNRSLYGRLEVTAGNEVVGQANNVAIYPPSLKRHMQVALNDRALVATEPLSIRYISEDPSDDQLVIAETTVPR